MLMQRRCFHPVLLLQRGIFFKSWMLSSFMQFVCLPSDSLAIEDVFDVTASCWVIDLGKGWETMPSQATSLTYVISLQRFITEAQIHEVSQTRSFWCSFQCTSTCTTLRYILQSSCNIAGCLLLPLNTVTSLLVSSCGHRVTCLWDQHV